MNEGAREMPRCECRAEEAQSILYHISRVCHSAMSDPHKSTALPSPTRSPTAPEPNLGPSRSDSTEVSVSVSVSAAAATTSDDAAEPEFRVYKSPETAAQQGS